MDTVSNSYNPTIFCGVINLFDDRKSIVSGHSETESSLGKVCTWRSHEEPIAEKRNETGLMLSHLQSSMRIWWIP